MKDVRIEGRVSAMGIPVVDASGRRIGTATVEGEQVDAVITDKNAAAVMRKYPEMFSMGFKVEAKPIPAVSGRGPADQGMAAEGDYTACGVWRGDENTPWRKIQESPRISQGQIDDLGERLVGLRHAWKGEPPIALDDVIDGVPLREMLARDEHDRREPGYVSFQRKATTPAQRAAVSAHWSAQLRARVAAGKRADAERATSVVVDVDPEDV